MGRELTPTLSVVIVARNEAERIRDCIESVLDVCEAVDGSEVILVDSNSSDGTVDIATGYPITVLRIPSDDLSSPSAGRHVGFRRARGNLVLFVDGDTYLEGGWLGDAVGTVRRDSDVAGVDGWLSDRGEREGESSGEVEYLRGVALYDATALEAVGDFDPRLRALEDVDLGYRLGRAGYRLVRLPVVVASHPSSSGIGERFRRWRRGYYVANGQVLRKSLDDPRLLAKWLYRFRLPLAAASWLVLGGLLVATLRVGLLLAWAAVSAAGIAAIAAARGVRWTTQKALSYLLFPVGMAIGFRRYGRTPAAYPLDRVEVVQTRTPDHV